MSEPGRVDGPAPPDGRTLLAGATTIALYRWTAQVLSWGATLIVLRLLTPAADGAALRRERRRGGRRDPAAQSPEALVVGDLGAASRRWIGYEQALRQDLTQIGGHVHLGLLSARDAGDERLVLLQEAGDRERHPLNTGAGEPQIARVPQRRQLAAWRALGEVTHELERLDTEVGPRRARRLNICGECDV